MTSTEARSAPIFSPRPAGGTSSTVAARLPRLAVLGGTGRLGSAVVRGAQAAGFPVAAIVGGPNRRRSRSFPADVEELPLFAAVDLALALAGTDVIVSATTAAAEELNIPRWGEYSLPAVVATTGLSPRTLRALRDASTRAPIVADTNFSLGVQILTQLARALGPLPDGFDLSISETHRRSKRDHPSGTAQALVASLSGTGALGWSEASGVREPGRVEIASLRGGDVPGQHTLWVSGPHEVVRIEHWAFGREAFVDGILAAARWLAPARGPPPRPGLYSLRDVLSAPRPEGA
jgi:4-hydroxy-tetrahydrodipicolinate reductase